MSIIEKKQRLKINSSFIAALFTIARTWKQPKCPSTVNKEDMAQIYNGILLSHKKK